MYEIVTFIKNSWKPPDFWGKKSWFPDFLDLKGAWQTAIVKSSFIVRLKSYININCTIFKFPTTIGDIPAAKGKFQNFISIIFNKLVILICITIGSQLNSKPNTFFRSHGSLRWPIAMDWRPSSCVNIFGS